eukprot:Opistho-2@6392
MDKRCMRLEDGEPAAPGGDAAAHDDNSGNNENGVSNNSEGNVWQAKPRKRRSLSRKDSLQNWVSGFMDKFGADKYNKEIRKIEEDGQIADAAHHVYKVKYIGEQTADGWTGADVAKLATDDILTRVLLNKDKARKCTLSIGIGGLRAVAIKDGHTIVDVPIHRISQYSTAQEKMRKHDLVSFVVAKSDDSSAPHPHLYLFECEKAIHLTEVCDKVFALAFQRNSTNPTVVAQVQHMFASHEGEGHVHAPASDPRAMPSGAHADAFGGTPSSTPSGISVVEQPVIMRRQSMSGATEFVVYGGSFSGTVFATRPDEATLLHVSRQNSLNQNGGGAQCIATPPTSAGLPAPSTRPLSSLIDFDSPVSPAEASLSMPAAAAIVTTFGFELTAQSSHHVSSQNEQYFQYGQHGGGGHAPATTQAYPNPFEVGSQSRAPNPFADSLQVSTNPFLH